MQWKLNGSSPVYLQLMQNIRRAVLQGEYPPGGRIPSVRDMAADAKVNPNTMQRALTCLEQEKLLIAVSTAGRYVTQDMEVLEQTRQRVIREILDTCLQQLQELGIDAGQACAMLEKKEAL